MSESTSTTTQSAPHSHDEWEPTWRLQLASALICGAVGIAADMAEERSTLANSLWVVSYIAGGWAAAIEVFERVRKLVVDVHFLMLAVALGAASLGQFAEGAILLFLFSLSSALEHFAEARTEDEVRGLLKNAPIDATQLLPDGTEKKIPADSIESGFELRLRPGDRVPADARVTRGTTNVDESMLTGEELPVLRSIGMELSAGSLVLDGGIDVVVLRPPAESTLQRMVNLVLDARGRRSPSQRITDRLGSRYTVAILVGSAVYFGILLTLGFEPNVAIYRAMTLLVACSPCALVLSIPSAILTAIAAGARMGILFRSGAAVENLALVDTFAFDKTGTLTSGELALHKVETAGDWNEEEVLSLAASAELRSEHPIGRSIVREARRLGSEPAPPEEFKAYPGEGIEATIGGRAMQLGTREFVSKRSGGRFPESWALVESSTRRVHIFVGEGHRSAMLSFEDDIRANAKGVLAKLRESGRRTMLVTGDREAPAREAAEAVGITEVLFRQAPEMKLELMTRLAGEGRQVAMVGDGVNDAAALAAAQVSIVMGGRGSDAAIEEAGIVLVGDRIANLWEAVRISEVARRIIVQNLVISGGIIVILAIAALTGSVKLPAVVVGHEGSTVIVVLNSLRIFLASRHRAVFD